MKRIIIPIIFILVAIFICAIAPNYYIGDTYTKDEIRVIVNGREVTHNKSVLPNEAYIVDGKIMLSQDTVDILFDKWLYYDEKYNTIISTTDTSVARMKLDDNNIQIDDDTFEIKVPTQKINEDIYIPIEELQDFYNIKVEYNEKIIITTSKADYISATLNKKIKIYAYKKRFSKLIATCMPGEEINVFEYKDNPEWVLVRRQNGDLGYAKISNIVSDNLEGNMPELPDLPVPKVNMIWEYAENYTPNRSGESKISSIAVVAPTWIYFSDNNGELRNTINRDYIDWAHNAGYKIWATFKNDYMGIENTSKMITDMKIREKIVSKLINICKEYNIDGINVDFENMRKNDSEEFSQFIRELSATARKNNIIISVDVTIPDGSDTWSLCYNRYQIADVADYLVVMTYDQYGSASKVPGSTAELSWVESNIKKLVERDGISAEKVIIGIPLYSRLWWISNGRINSSAINMNTANSYIDRGAEWDEDAGQYYIEYDSGNSTYYLWIENEDSAKEKLSLIKKYNLAGAAYWRLGFETSNFWGKISD